MSQGLRDRLVHAARELLKEPGVTKLDLRRVAKKAGVSQTAHYVAWGRKKEGGGIEALQIGVAASGFRDLAERLRLAQRDLPGERGALAAVGEEYFAFAEGNPALFRIMFGEEAARGLGRINDGGGRHPEVDRLLEGRRDTQQAIRFALDRDLDRGGLLGIGTREAVLAAWAMFHGAAMLLIDGQFELENLTPRAAKELVVSYLLAEPVAGLLEAAADLARAKLEKGQVPEFLADAAGDPSPSFLPQLSSPRQPTTPTEHPKQTSRNSGLEKAGALLSDPSPEMWFANSTTLQRVSRNARVLEGARILWIDDHPDWSRHEERFFVRLGAAVVRALDTEEALDVREPDPVDVVISDIARDGSDRAGLDDLPSVMATFSGAPVIFYVGRVDVERPAPPGSFGITDDPEELVHLVLDVLERRRP
jgi:AcrR family transcriptional regulator